MELLRTGLFFLLLLLGLIMLSIWRRHLRESKQLRLREIIHTERMKAMESSLPLPAANDKRLEELWGNLADAGLGASHATQSGMFWVRLLALCLGLTCLLGGIGVAVAFLTVPRLGVAPLLWNFWSLGLIPVFIGIGLLLFYHLSRSLARPSGNRTPAPGESGDCYD
jgi:hypothetical protein